MRRNSFNRAANSVLLAVALAAAVVMPRALLVARAHSDTVDDEYHLTRGIRYWSGMLAGTHLNDPPLGEALGALPLYLAGVRVDANDPDPSALYGQRRSPETLQLLMAGWKAILSLTLVACVFAWAREVYGIRAAWVAAAVLSLEPNFAAHVHVGSVDVLGVEGIVIGCYVAWRYFERPTVWRAAVVGIAIAVALLLKHTAVILPGVIVGYGVIWWIGKKTSSLFPVLRGEGGGEGLGAVRVEVPIDGAATAINRSSDSACRAPLAPALSPEYRGEGVKIRHLALAVIICIFSMWALTRFDYSHPAVAKSMKSQTIWQHLPEYVPAGTYVGSLLNGMAHADRGHAAYLFGQKSKSGWWYYFPVVAFYKVPIAVFVLLGMSLASMLVMKPRFPEWSIVLPMIAWTIFLMCSSVNIGFRHFLAPYAFMLMFAARAAGVPCGRWFVSSVIVVCALAIDSAIAHPNYLSYFNFPRHKPYLAINDSNVDWGQSLKQIRAWVNANPRSRAPYLRYFGKFNSPNVKYYLDNRVRVLDMDDPPPREGILIMSPFWEAGVWDDQDRYRFLREKEPIAVIGRAMRVYDLDAMPR